METYALLSSVITTLSFVLFVGIVLWAWSGRRRDAFAHAAQAPFALPDDADPPAGQAGVSPDAQAGTCESASTRDARGNAR